MKKLTLAVAVVLITSLSHAWEFAKNPDRFPSIGLNLTREAFSGQSTYPSMPSVGSQDHKMDAHLVVLDLRLPVSDSFTMNIAAGAGGQNYTADETPHLSSISDDSSIGYFNLGIRYYFNH